MSYVYEDTGRPSSLRYLTDPGNSNYSNSTSFGYDGAGRLSAITHNFTDSGIKMGYEYNAIGNITKAVQDDTENLYTYDELSRLVSWTEKRGGQVVRSERYFYDGNGNLLRVEKTGSAENHSYDAANQLTDEGFAYDECGNLTSDGTWAYAYDRGSRLVSATNATANLKLVFTYDPQGRRRSKVAYERDPQGNYTAQKYAVFYHYDAGGNVLCETDASGNILRSYAYDLSGHPVAFTQDLGQGVRTFYLHANARGDVVCITDDVMNWVKKFSYDPWGNITSEVSRSPEYDNLDCPYAYAGYFGDKETGLYYMPARYYPPALRRFLTRDPHPGVKSNPLTLNPYRYCENDPVNRVDPAGQSSVKISGMPAINVRTISGPININIPRPNIGNLDLAGFSSMVSLVASAGPGLHRFASGMASFNSQVHASMARSGGFGRGMIGGGAKSISAAMNAYSTARAVRNALGMVKDALGKVRLGAPHPAVSSATDFMGMIDAVWSGVNRGARWIGNALISTKIFAPAGYCVKLATSVSQGTQDLTWVLRDKLNWKHFWVLRAFDVAEYIPCINIPIGVAEEAYRIGIQ
ncbi:MAG: hypothetical protein HPY75_06080 [Actinobacteria bacterium]|nr:hypothetical protein [Actinomycetota bacterium]